MLKDTYKKISYLNKTPGSLITQVCIFRKYSVTTFAFSQISVPLITDLIFAKFGLLTV